MVVRTIAGDSENVIIEGACISCGKEWTVKAPMAGVIARQNGALIQVAFPKMSADERELFVSDICDDCFPKFPKLGDDPSNWEEEEDADPAAELNADEIEGDKLGDDPSNY